MAKTVKAVFIAFLMTFFFASSSPSGTLRDEKALAATESRADAVNLFPAPSARGTMAEKKDTRPFEGEIGKGRALRAFMLFVLGVIFIVLYRRSSSRRPF